MENIAFGQYYPGNSWIYKLDPRLKIIATISLIVFIFLIPMTSINGLYMMLGALALYILAFLTTGIPILKVLNGLKPILFLLVFTVILQLIYTTGEQVTLLYTIPMTIGLYQTLIMVSLIVGYFFIKKYLPFKTLFLFVILFICFMVMWDNPFEKFNWNFNFNWASWNFNIYEAGVIRASFIALRIVLMLGITSLLTLSTMSTDINNGLEAVLSPLKLFKIPVGIFSMLISLTLRFIPTLMIESKKIMNAQASRGVDFSEGSLKDKVNQIIALLIPMFVISFKRAEDLSNAMEARGYIVGAKRTKIDELKLRWRDYLFIVFLLLLLASVILGRIYFA